MSESYLDLDVTVRRGEKTLRFSLQADPGETIAVVGPNGAGKSTLLDAVAGTAPTEGSLHVAGQDWRRVPTHRRRVALVHQDHALFPHLSVRANVEYGARARGTGRAEARRRASDLLQLLEVGELAERRPGQLSGGQSQRVALARALATEPEVVLLDEPFAALDVAVAQRLREVLAERLAGFTGVTLLVTHDAVDLFTLADRVLVVEDGAVAQCGTPAEVAALPRTPHAARLVGRNVLHGRATKGRVVLDEGPELVTATPAEGPVLVTFNPSAVTLTTEEPHGSARNRWRTVVRRLVGAGDGATVRAHLGPPTLTVDLTTEAVAELGLHEGGPVWASLKATDVTVQEASA
ncbi:ABC transporter ATP-binding protein [Marmoricola endophyticus]|uniref:ABC transporter ATP-binding protein n=1 Tax=Marmoricola endophyticus TaxID=2040280 RepID=A0A917F7X5_9ACTN|nr:ABC transporter ATP-binding protein [Marmoricola endophyticus]GGF54327.1 ABC transporter ATP-binding protein [Marmoricola endophyticus]